MPDSFVEGKDFSSETGLQSGDDLNDLVTQATFAPGSPALDQTTIEDDGTGAARVKAGGIDTNELATDAVEAAKIKDGEVTHPKLATDAVEVDNIKDGEITKAKMATGAVVPAATEIYAFKAYRSAALNITNGAIEYVVFDATDHDHSGGAYAAGIFTAPVDGVFFFFGSVTYASLAVAKGAYAAIGAPSGGAPGATWRFLGNRFTVGGASQQAQFVVAGDIELTTGDEVVLATAHTEASPEALTVGIARTYFGGRLVATV